MPALAAAMSGDHAPAATSPHYAQAQADSAPGLDSFLNETGHLILPPGYSGSLNPAGFRLVSAEGEALRFAPVMPKGGGSPDDDGSWTGFGGIRNGCNGTVLAVAVGGAGEVYVGGEFTLCGDTPANRVARFNTTTQTWAPLGSGAANGVNDVVRALAVSGSDLFMGGFFTQAGGAAANRVARFNTTTQTWTPLGSGAANGVNSAVIALAVSGSDLVVGGFFTQAGGAPANRVARFNTTTQTWTPLGSGAANGVNNGVLALAVSGSDLVVGGVFNQAGGAAANGVARFNTTTQTWAPLGSGAANGVNSTVNAIAVSGSDLLMGGRFTQAGGAAANRVARFNTTTQTWAPLGSGAANGVNDAVLAIAVSGSDLYVGGLFSEAGGTAASGVARFDTTTQTWAPLGSGAANGVSGSVIALAVSGSDLFVGGDSPRPEARRRTLLRASTPPPRPGPPSAAARPMG